jgi:hypothetical protein
MIQAASSDDVRHTRKRATSNGTPFWLTTFIGTNRVAREQAEGEVPPAPAPGEPHPMAFLVEQDPDVTVGAHFHQAPQFQVVVAGEGRMASHPVRGVAVHYTNAYTAYGPIVAGGEGLNYYTLRNGYDPGARYMPAQRLVLKAAADRQHREAMSDPLPALDAAALRALAAPATLIAIPPEPDGMGAWRHRLPPGARVTGPDPASGGGQFWLVLAGALDHAERGMLPVGSCVFVPPEERTFAAAAGPDGLEVLAMQYPRRA